MTELTNKLQEKHQAVQTAALMAMAMAAECGRAGKLSNAERILCDLLKTGIESAEVYDLLARVFAQMGRYGESVEMWQKAINIDPTNKSFKQSQRCALNASKRKRLYRVIIVLLSIIMLFGGTLLYYYTHQKISSVASTGTQSSYHQTTQNVEEASPARFENLDDVTINVPHVSKIIEGNKLILSFDEGLFASGDKLKSDAQLLLLQLAHQLQKYSNIMDITIVGITDDLPVREAGQYRDNYALGMARAISVIEYLRSTTPLSGDLFSLRTSGSGDAPYPNDSSINRLKNRTVKFIVTEKKENN